MQNSTRKTITLPNHLWNAISDFRHKNKISTEAHAIRKIIAKALGKKDA